ncbi:MAG: argininosuccinate lyase [Pseudomonadota bacterium]
MIRAALLLLVLSACQPFGNAGVSIGTDGVNGRVGTGVVIGGVTVGASTGVGL